MEIRNYNQFGIIKSASIITSEVVEKGKSGGWQGSINDLEEIGKILAIYNIKYVNDFNGVWARRI